MTPRTGCRPVSRVAALLAVFLASGVFGCQTIRSWEKGCPGVYSGVRYYRDLRTWVPTDGRIFYTLDLPLTAVADTLLVPFGAIVDPVRPAGGFPPGCRWAD